MQPRANQGTVSQVASSSASVLLLAANPNRKKATISNDSTAILTLLLGDGKASSTNYTVQIAAKGTLPTYYEVPSEYAGTINGIWASANGNAYVTEMV